MSSTSKVDLVGVGLNATDTLIPVHHYPAPGAKVEFRSANVLPGGQVATAMVACQSWGLRTRYVGKVGHDLSTAPPASTNRRTANPGCAHFLPAQVSDRANQALRQPWHQRGGHDKRFSSSF